LRGPVIIHLGMDQSPSISLTSRAARFQGSTLLAHEVDGGLVGKRQRDMNWRII
jgi:hypothetical protein